MYRDHLIASAPRIIIHIRNSTPCAPAFTTSSIRLIYISASGSETIFSMQYWSNALLIKPARTPSS